MWWLNLLSESHPAYHAIRRSEIEHSGDLEITCTFNAKSFHQTFIVKFTDFEKPFELPYQLDWFSHSAILGFTGMNLMLSAEISGAWKISKILKERLAVLCSFWHHLGTLSWEQLAFQIRILKSPCPERSLTAVSRTYGKFFQDENLKESNGTEPENNSLVHIVCFQNPPKLNPINQDTLIYADQKVICFQLKSFNLPACI